MHVSYDDILHRIPEPPLCWSNGVPRYEPFEPHMTSVYAGEALLVEAKCQHCGCKFNLGVQSSLHRPEYGPAIQEGDIRLDDPPSHDCDGPGNSMTSMPVRVLEFWEKVNVSTNPKQWSGEWRRVPSLEIEFPDN